MKQMIEKDPLKRASAQECLNSEWILNNGKSESGNNSPNNLNSAHENMRKFQEE